MEVVIEPLGLTGELPLGPASIVLALYTDSANLRALALFASVKDLMIYIVVAAAVVLVPSRLGRYVLQPGTPTSIGHYTMTRPDLWAGHVAEFMRWVEAPRS